MSDALVAPFLVASLLLSLAGVLKLRSPLGTGAALRSLGLPGRPWAVRVLAAGEIVLGAACALSPTRGSALALAAVYQLFAVVAVVLMRRRLACGCFGDNDLPVTLAHVIASELLGALALAAALASPHGIGWLASQPALKGVVLAIGIAGALYATVLVYTTVPRAWAAWSGE